MVGERLRVVSRRVVQGAILSALVALTMLPVLNLARIIATTGADNPNNDDLRLLRDIIFPVLDGTYDWRNYPRDTFLNVHSFAVPTLVYLAATYFADLNLYTILYLGLFLTAVRAVLLYDAFTRTRRQSPVRVLLWPLLASTGFSVTQISVFEYPNGGIAMILSQFGFALGVWGLARFPGRWWGIGVVAVTEIICTLSYGTGLVMWPVFFIGLVLLGFRKAGHYLVWLGVGILASWPYIDALVLTDSRGGRQATVESLTNIRLLIKVLGWPFANNTARTLGADPAAFTYGLLGVALAIGGLALLAIRRRHPAWGEAAPALMLLAYALLNAWQISLFRPQLGPWYPIYSLPFWMGLVGLAYVLWVNRSTGDVVPTFARQFRPTRSLALVTQLWSVAVVVAVALLLAQSNRTYADKSMFLTTRSPAAAACLRHYRTAPTHCEERFFVLGAGYYDYLGEVAPRLEQHHLSVFAPRQEWTLQGDFGLDNVRVHEAASAPDIWWTADRSAGSVPWSDYRHLNLFLHTPNAVSWTITLPPNLKQADFHSAIAISEAAPRGPASDGVRFEVSLARQGEAEQPLFSRHLKPEERDWQPFSIPLTDHAGQTVTLRLTSNPGENNVFDWAMYRYPRIDLTLDPAKAVMEDRTVGSPAPTPTPADVVFAVDRAGLWQASGMQPLPAGTGAPASWAIGDNPFLHWNHPLDLCMADYSHAYVRIAASPGIHRTLRKMRVYYQLDGQATWNWMTIPLRADGALHEYGYDLKLLELPRGARLTGLRLAPVQPSPLRKGDDQVQIADVRLIRGERPGGCTP